jgi:hypothetical protein
MFANVQSACDALNLSRWGYYQWPVLLWGLWVISDRSTKYIFTTPRLVYASTNTKYYVVHYFVRFSRSPKARVSIIRDKESTNSFLIGISAISVLGRDLRVMSSTGINAFKYDDHPCPAMGSGSKNPTGTSKFCNYSCFGSSFLH